MKNIIFLFLLLVAIRVQSQIIIDNTAPYNSAAYLVDDVLLGGGVVATNHAYQGEPSQIGWFNAVNTNLGIDDGIVMCTGDINYFYTDELDLKIANNDADFFLSTRIGMCFKFE